MGKTIKTAPALAVSFLNNKKHKQDNIMKKLLTFSAASFLLAVNAFCAEPNLIKDSDFAQNNKFWKLAKGWSITPEKGQKGTPCAKLEYDIKNKWSKLAQTVKLETESYYKLSFYYRSEKTDGDSLKLIASTSNKFIPKWNTFKLSNKWTEGAYYFYSGKTDQITFGWYLDGKEPNVVFMDNISLNKIEDMELPGKSFLRNSKFEDSKNGWSFPKKWGKLQVDGAISIDASTGCLDGKKSLKLDTSKSASEKNACAVAHSGVIPIVPGKNYVLEFWSKAQKTDTPLIVIVDSYISPFIPPHWYKRKSIMIDNTLRKYTMEVYIPEIKESPALAKRLVFLKFALEKHRDAVWIDNVNFTIKKRR